MLGLAITMPGIATCFLSILLVIYSSRWWRLLQRDRAPESVAAEPATEQDKPEEVEAEAAAAKVRADAEARMKRLASPRKRVNAAQCPTVQVTSTNLPAIATQGEATATIVPNLGALGPAAVQASTAVPATDELAGGALQNPHDSELSSFAWMAATETERRAVLDLIGMIRRKDPVILDSPLLSAFGGLDRCFLCYLRAGDVNFDLLTAMTRLQQTVAWRAKMGLDGLLETDLMKAINNHPLRPSWPCSVEIVAPNGSPVMYMRVGLLHPRALIKDEDGLRHFLALWLSRALELQKHTCRERLCQGTYDIYDCAGLSIKQLSPGPLRALSRCVALGTTHFPENLHKCFVINAPRIITIAWKAVHPVLNQRTRAKVSITSGVPASLVKALGGEEQLQEVFATVPTPK